MSLVDTSTGEIVVMSERDARELIDGIKTTGDMMWRQIVRAFQGRAWIALGYASWDELCEQEFGGARIKLPREERQEVVASLRDAGMSQPAIAAATGVSQQTVSLDLTNIGNHEMPKPQAPITGLDGKTYTPPTPKPEKHRRPPLADSASTAAWKLRKGVESLERVFADDRFSTNRDQVAAHTRSHLTFAVEVCQDLLHQLDNQSKED